MNLTPLCGWQIVFFGLLAAFELDVPAADQPALPGGAVRHIAEEGA